ncbi:phage minor capsid protein [Nocardia asteroides]|uniref:phage minor capsid protein n=1 Tax=Nocardia asteroides TaxID=1824 RepID=UPI0033C5279B
MAFDPAAVTGVSDGIAQIYADAEVQLLARVAAAIQKGIETPQWVSVQLAEISRLSSEARGFLLDLDPIVRAQIQDALALAHATGMAAADGDIPGAPSPAAAPVVSQEAVAALAAEAIASVASSHTQILRAVNDGYRSTVAEAAGRMVTGVATRREVTQQLLDTWAAKGLSGFRDRAGRNWRPETYAEMCVRTAALRALKQGHTDRLLARGYDVVVISSHRASAPQCKPFQGALVSLTGQTPAGPIEGVSRMTGQPVRETVLCSMAEAEARGLHHPNCKHTHTAWIPGAPRPAVHEDDDDQAYNDEQTLRRLERGVREAKRRQAAAITPEAKKKAAALVRARQAAIRDHVANTDVKRKRHREQLVTGDPAKAQESVKLTRTEPPPPPAAVSAVPEPVAAVPAARGPREFKHLTDEELDAAFADAVEREDIPLLERLSVEDGHRQELARKQAERAAAKDAEYDRLIAEGLDDEEAIERAYGVSVTQQRRTNAIAMLRANGFTGKGFDELAAASHKDLAYSAWLGAEEATNGYMLSAAGEAAGIDPRRLWHMNEQQARKYASEELRGWWDQNGRVTLAEHKEELVDPAAAARMRNAREDFLQ